MANPNPTHRWTKGQASPNPTGKAKPQLAAARTLAAHLREAVSDAQIGEWLLAIFAGRDPFVKVNNTDNLPQAPSVPLDWTHRMAAMKMLLERRDGMPMQAVVLKGELEMRARAIDDAAGVIQVSTLDASARAALRRGLAHALGEPIDAESVEVAPTPPQARQPIVEPVAVEAPQSSAPNSSTVHEQRSNPPDGLPVDITPPKPIDGRTREAKQVLPEETPLDGHMVLTFPHSSNVASADLNVDTGVVSVSFHSPRGLQVYQFLNVTRPMMAAWREAESAGSWFSREIRQKFSRHPMIKSPKGPTPGTVL